MCAPITPNEQGLRQNMPPKTEEDGLVTAAKSGDSTAFEALVARHKGLVLAITRRMTGSFEEAEDLTQQAFMKAFVNLSRFDGRSSFSTWLVTIAMNEARMWHRRARRTREVSMTEIDGGETLDKPLEVVDWRPTPEVAYSQKERSRLLLSAMDRLKPGIRKALQLCDLEERTTMASALLLGISVHALKSRRLRARLELRQRLGSSLISAKRRSRKGAHDRATETANQPNSYPTFDVATSPDLECPAGL